ncbi:MAG: molybdopterin-dependent oxidoreductase [Chloroflexi bacterium]|nr:molybdopterin-dependent oxidoreductase [Chloroflexota bacterium]
MEQQVQPVERSLGQQVEGRPRWSGFWAGVWAGIAMTALMVAMRFSLDTIVLPELLADWVLKLTPPRVFDFVLTRLEVGAKPLLFGSLLAGQTLAGGGIGVLYARYGYRLPISETLPWARGTLLGLALAILLAGALTPVIGGGFFGTRVVTGAGGYLWATFLPVLAYGLVVANLHTMGAVRGAARSTVAAKPGRREFLQRAGFFALVVGVAGFAGRSIVQGVSAITPARVSYTAGQLPPEITPNDTFYEISKNIINPRMDAGTWKLEIGGDVGNPLTLTYEELKALAWVEEYATLQCISNPVGGPYISNALWRGVPLKDLLEQAQLPPGTERLAFRAADGYVDSFPVEIAMRPQTIVAYMMNGEPLPHNHGFPARIIVPGLWGMENVKWLTRIEPVPASFRGYWQVRGWADSADQNTMSRIDVPPGSADVPIGAEVLVGGVAFAGDRGIREVEFSPDDGMTWYPAEVRKALSPYTWQLWTGNWTPAAQGIQILKVRAVDGKGTPQIAQVRDSLPGGATGYHMVLVAVVKPEGVG